MFIPVGTAATLGAHGVLARDLARNQPYANSVTPQDYEKLLDAADARAAASSRGEIPGANINAVVPSGDMRQRLDQALFSSDSIAGNARDKQGRGYNINFNPNADKAIFAHELGHVTSDRTKVGHMIRNARSNPQLANVLGKAAYLAPGAVAAITPGDEDMATSVALAYAASAPKILDEALATKEGLALMDTAGMRASLGQRGKLAAGLMTYLGAPVLMAAASNTVGNLMDDELVGKSPGEMMPR